MNFEIKRYKQALIKAVISKYLNTMMAYRNLFVPILTLISLLMSSCNHESLGGGVATTDISCALKGEKKNFLLSSVAEQINYFPLLTDTQVILDQIVQVCQSGNYVCILDVKDQVVLFDGGGAFIRRIGRIGRGPGEFVNVGAVDISEKLDLLVLKERMGKKVIKYRLSTGEMLEEFIDDSYARYISIMEDGRLFFYVPYPSSVYGAYQPNQVLIGNTENNIEVKLLLGISEKPNKPIGLPFSVSRSGDSWYIFDAREKSVSKFDGKKVTPVFRYRFDNSVKIDLDFDPGNPGNRSSGFLKNCIPIGCYYYFMVDYQTKVVYGVYDTCTKQCGIVGGLFEGGGLIDDIHNGPHIRPNAYAGDRAIYDFISYADYNSILEKNQRKIKKENLTKDEMYERFGGQEVLRIVSLK